MTLESVFQWASTGALLGWAMLAAGLWLRPGVLRRLSLMAGGRVVPLGLAVLYVVLLVLYWRSAPGGGFGSLEAVTRLFASPGKLLGGWLHYLAFDLFIGRWMIDDTLQASRPRWPVMPCLAATLMFGPIGLLSYFVIRAFGERVRPAPANVMP